MTKKSYLYQGRLEDGLCMYCGKPGVRLKGRIGALSYCRRHRKAHYPGNATCPACDYYGLYLDTPSLVKCAHCSYSAPYPS